MTDAKPCHEVCLYRVKDAAKADAQFPAAKAVLSTFPGFIAWSQMVRGDDALQRIDHVVWRTTAEAASAAEKFMTHPAFADFMQNIDGEPQMGHYVEA